MRRAKVKVGYQVSAVLTYIYLLIIGVAHAQESGVRDVLPIVVSQQAMLIHQATYVFDGHNDLPWEIRSKGSRSLEKIDISQPQPQLHTDIGRLREGGVGAQFWSVYVPASADRNGQAHQMTLEQIDIVHAMMQKYPETFELARTHADVVRIRKAGKIASMIGVEGGHSIENSLEKLRRLFDLGARYMTLTHNRSLDWAAACIDQTGTKGLSEFGKAVVLEMNRLGMLVDLSHVAPETMQATLDICQAPVIFSHSSSRTVADHVRNVPDQILRQLPKNGGIVMINFFSGFIVPESASITSRMLELEKVWEQQYAEDAEAIAKERARYRAENPLQPGTVYHVVEHIDHAVKVAGVDHVGIGSDFDGVPMLPKGLEDVSCYPVITQLLLDRGYTAQSIDKIMSGNMLRVLQQAEQAAIRLQQAGGGP
jgi:membrane dipeptidase